MAAKPMTKSKIVAAVAEKVGITKKQSALVLETLAQLSHKEAKNGFTFPGVGKLVLLGHAHPAALAARGAVCHLRLLSRRR